MSYVTVDDLKSTSKMVISFWFRAPSESIAKAKAAGDAAGDDAPMKYILPLVVMGKRGQNKSDNVQSEEVTTTYSGSGWAIGGSVGTEFTILNADCVNPPFCSVHDVTLEVDVNVGATFVPVPTSFTQTRTIQHLDGSQTKKTDPSYIGLDCSSSPPMLVVNFESAKMPVQNNTLKITTGIPTLHFGGGADSGQFAMEQGTVIESYRTPPFGLLIEDDGGSFTREGSIVNVNFPEGTDEGPGPATQVDVSDDTGVTGSIYSDQVEVTPDKWHHVLVSVNFTSVATHGGFGGSLKSHIDAKASIWVALDDKNYLGSNLSSVSVDDGNGVVTDEALGVANQGNFDDTIPTYNLSDPTIPLDAPLGIPATVTYTDHIFSVEMGVFQIYTGVTVDTASKDIRRLFITEPSKDKNIQKPAPRGRAKKFFGRDPDVKFFSFSEWTDQQVANGEIDKYKPSPNLGGDQGK